MFIRRIDNDHSSHLAVDGGETGYGCVRLKHGSEPALSHMPPENLCLYDNDMLKKK